ncbi:MAG: sulfur carrier protein ThiS adenylyltransferase ThiF [Deferribacteraceae bacterium]|jgi:sulfur carrier protein ThiS adenylyltransferase|nr:sulfur carrier protein ThiS adenylyltransferase ThiF [Deferribacteraceae bacterium]
MKAFIDMLIERHGHKIYDTLKNARIGIAGLGGLGSHVATSLTRMGVGEIVGADFDIVEISNIHRQCYFLDQVGMKKCEALSETLSRISPLTNFTLLDTTIDTHNVKSLFHGCDVIIEAFDAPSAKAMLFDAWQTHFPEIFYIGSSGLAGYTDEPPIAIKQLGGNAYIVGDMISEISENAGLMAGRVGIAASMQANLAIKLIIAKNLKID